jgi:hypothetical protein
MRLTTMSRLTHGVKAEDRPDLSADLQEKLANAILTPHLLESKRHGFTKGTF